MKMTLVRFSTSWANDEEARELGRVESFDVFLEEVREVAPQGSILVLEDLNNALSAYGNVPNFDVES